MRVTAYLAFSQLIRKRSRSLVTILIIALSTSLTTAVCSLVASGNEMLVQTLGADYASYGNAYKAMLLVPAVIFGGLILTMSVIVISNVFKISAGERLSQFGTLKCVGATGKQITETVMYESIFLSIIAIPAGVLCGILFTYLGAAVDNKYLDDLNRLVNMMIRKFTMSLEVVIAWQVLLFSGVISFLAVLYSAYRPASRAGKKAALECMKQVEITGFALTRKEKEKSSLLLGSIEGGLAFTNVRRNRHKTKSAITVLSISIVLFIVLSGLQDIARRAEEYLNFDAKQTIIVDYVSNREGRVNPDTGRREYRSLNPITAATAAQITEELKAYTDKDFIAYGNDYDTYFAMLSREMLTEDMKEVLAAQEWELADWNEFEVEILSVDDKTYQELCDAAGVKMGAAILLNSYTYNDRGREKRIVPFAENMETILLEKADGTAEEVIIEGMLTTEEIPEDFFFLNMNPIRIVMPDVTVRGYSWMSSPEDEEGYMEYAEEVLEKYFPGGVSDEYMELGYSTRVYRTDDYAKVMNIAIMIATVFLYSFVIMLTVIGMMNVISTISANVQMRAREFAVLQSIGMTRKDLEKMLNLESLICVGKALIYGLPIGLILILLLNYTMIQIMPIGFSIPWLAMVVVFLAVFLIIWGTIHASVRKMKNQNIIETILASNL